ncbi:hypothetical protein TNIN_339711 [Trichonephila inaurata madagascariensis]|uniref:Reverse transcriptase/retrotransposon-derived protein RNase H-like domain-containing protein n=1 Tax=Trichonephila inaurata madagascariensis TaxID=2747483 RepID=A0A8X6YIY6_9ARAC|nr:hypothetical protein TNIN_339711 [Trichonephila inaurata madagascariensis]
MPFEELKTRLSKNPVLYRPDFTKPFIIQCDASNLGIGVVCCRSLIPVASLIVSQTISGIRHTKEKWRTQEEQVKNGVRSWDLEHSFQDTERIFFSQTGTDAMPSSHQVL